MTDTAKALEVLRQGTPGPFTISGVRTRLGGVPVLQILGADDKVWFYVPYSDRTTKDHADSYQDARRIAANPLLVDVFAAAVHARSLERAADFKTLEAWHTEATKRYAALDAAIAAVVKEVSNG